MAKQINLFFSGAPSLDASQLDINQSLGGFCSNTPIPKNLLNSVFSSLSNFDMANLSTDVVALFIKNTGDEDIPELKFSEIYEQLLNVETNICKVEVGFVIPNESGFMELIGSRKEHPYYVEFFEAKFKREEAILKILTPGQVGNLVDLLGVDIILTDTSISGLINDIVASFKNNSEFLVERYSDTEIYIRRKGKEQTGEEIELLSPGTSSSNVVNFAGEDNSVAVIENFKVGEILGIWLKRTVIEDKIDCNINTNTDKVENLELVFSF